MGQRHRQEEDAEHVQYASTKCLWKPSSQSVERANLTRFIRRINAVAPEVGDYPDLYQYSIDHPELFWSEVWDFCKITASRKWDQVVDDVKRMPGARWFSGARLNFAQNLLRYRDDHPAIIGWNESGRHQILTYSELFRRSAGFAVALQKAGVQVGDRVAGFMPNIAETIIAMLGTSILGAYWSSCSPDFGAKGVVDRFGQIQPRILVCADGYQYAGKPFDRLGRVRAILEQIPAISKVVVVPYLNSNPDISRIPNALLWKDFAGLDEEIDFQQLPFDHPLYIMYSSGTTGLPKCMVHGAGGTLIQHLKELVLHTDLRREDRIFYATTCGWMMWNWLVSSLAVGATVLLYDGSPFHRRPEILFDLAEQEEVTVFGTSAKYLSLAEKNGLHPSQTHDLESLRTILSTGSPLAPASFDYVYRQIKRDVCLSSISGGTDLISSFALGNPIGAVFRGELQTLGLGMKVEIFNEAGRPTGREKGELVCSQAFPSMPLKFWNDADGARYQKAYFNHFPGVWRHGDWARLTSNGGMIIYGRSDATLNPGGVRIGTAEIYRQVEHMEEVLEAIVVGQEWEDDVRIVLFVRLKEGLTLNETLIRNIQTGVRESASPHHVPRKVVQVADIPRTISGKISELAVSNVIHGREVTNTDALANPEALDLYRDLKELEE